tara:strand:- start:367 stop:975 length:609 start_codon:yes stop_codon:yes gene_type:complete
MNQSESITDLATALCLAQAEMGGAIKDSNNTFFKSSYADLTSVIKVIKEPFSKYGLSFVQLPVTSAGGNGVGVSTMLMHKSGQWLQSEYLLPMDKVTPQGAGSAITYARRYALQSLVGIPSVDDDSEMAMYRNEPEPVAPPAKRVSKKLMQDLVALVIESEATSEHTMMNEALAELDENEKQKLWSQCTGKQQEFIRSKKGM